MTRTVGFVILLVPAIAAAQDTPPPDQPPAPAPVVIVNPPPPAPAPVVEQQSGTEVYDYWNAPVFATGALVFLGSYGASVVVAGSSDHPGADRLYVPIVGPWLALNDWGHCPITSPSCDSATTDKVLLVADGVFQAAGIVTMLDGLFEPSHHTVWTRTADTKLHISPTHNGVTMFGRF